VCIATGNVSKPHRCSSQEASSQPSASLVTLPDSSVYTVVGGRHDVTFAVSSQPGFGCRSVASTDTSATSTRPADDKSVVGGILYIYYVVASGLVV